MSNDSLLKFPAPMSIRALGAGGDDFRILVRDIVRKHAPEISESNVSVRHSQGGRYVSVTVRIYAQSQVQMNAIYRDLTAHDRVMMAL